MNFLNPDKPKFAKSTKAAGVTMFIANAGDAIAQIKVWKNQYEARRNYTASIDENTYLYRPMMKWLNSQVSGKKYIFTPDNDTVVRFYDDSGASKVVIDGHTLNFHVQRPSMEVVSSSLLDRGSMSKKLVFTSPNPKAIDALQELVAKIGADSLNRARTPYLHNVVGTGYWEENSLHRKSIDSVFLPDGVKEDLMEDLNDFLTQKDIYDTVGIPWHRGYLLHGEPGNGKSSIVSALASHFNLHIYNMPLSAVKDDQKLAELVADIETKSILLIEDIDIFSDSIKREQADHGVTLAGLLNSLDGVATPQGLVTFITTNKKEKLDEALIRPGRVDYDLELIRPVASQISNMFKKVYDQDLGDEPREFKSMAEVANVFKVNLKEPDAVRKNLIVEP